MNSSQIITTVVSSQIISSPLLFLQIQQQVVAKQDLFENFRHEQFDNSNKQDSLTPSLTKKGIDETTDQQTVCKKEIRRS